MCIFHTPKQRTLVAEAETGVKQALTPAGWALIEGDKVVKEDSTKSTKWKHSPLPGNLGKPHCNIRIDKRKNNGT